MVSKFYILLSASRLEPKSMMRMENLIFLLLSPFPLNYLQAVASPLKHQLAKATTASLN